MGNNQFERTELLLGQEATKTLNKARVAVFGIGGVGGFTTEALARSGLGTIDLIDHDKISLTNINRQIIASHKTLGQYKVDVMRERIIEINPKAKVNVYRCFYNADVADEFDFSKYDYIVDAIDTVSSKIEMICRAKEADVPIISCMGAGNKLDPTKFEVADIYESSVCPLAKVMRKELRARGIRDLKVVYSKEPTIKPNSLEEANDIVKRKQVPGSVSFVPSVAGLIIGGQVIKDIIGLGKE